MKEIRFSSGTKIYVVVSRFVGGGWGIAHNWYGLPYASESFAEAQNYRNEIADLAVNYKAIYKWRLQDFKVVKFTPELLK